MIRRFCLLLLATALLLLPAASFPQPSSSSVARELPRVAPPPPDAAPAELEQRGDELRGQKYYIDAIAYYSAALKKQRTAERYNKLGIAELQAEHFGNAKKNFERAIKMNKQYPEAYNNLGATLYIQGKSGKAIELYLKALQLEEQNASFHANLGTAYLARKQYDKMALEFARALQIEPAIFERTSETGSSLQLQSAQERARFNYALAKIYARNGNAERSLHYLRKALEEGYAPVTTIYKDAEFATLRKDPRFAQLLASPPVAIREQ